MESTSLPSLRLDWQTPGHLRSMVVALATRCSGVVILNTAAASMALALLHALVSSALSGSCLSLMAQDWWRGGFPSRAFITQRSSLPMHTPLDSDEATKDAFYNRLDEILRRIPNNDNILLMKDFNARVGSNHLAWEGVLGRDGVGSCNANSASMALALLHALVSSALSGSCLSLIARHWWRGGFPLRAFITQR